MFLSKLVEFFITCIDFILSILVKENKFIDIICAWGWGSNFLHWWCHQQLKIPSLMHYWSLGHKDDDLQSEPTVYISSFDFHQIEGFLFSPAGVSDFYLRTWSSALIAGVFSPWTFIVGKQTVPRRDTKLLVFLGFLGKEYPEILYKHHCHNYLAIK